MSLLDDGHAPAQQLASGESRHIDLVDDGEGLQGRLAEPAALPLAQPALDDGGVLVGSKAVKLCTAGRVAESLDPVFEVTTAPVRAWVQAVWLSSQPGESSLGLMGKALEAAAKRPRARCAGPVRAFLTALHRVRWQVLSATKWVTDDGVALDLSLLATVLAWRTLLGKQLFTSAGVPSLPEGRMPVENNK